jgi:hypothetical protein
VASETFASAWSRIEPADPAPHDATRKPPPGEGSASTLPELSLGGSDAVGPQAHDLLLDGLIGEGGMGTVWSARQPSLDRVVAVKRPRPDAPDAVRRALVAEARVLGALEHPNIVPVHLLGVDADGAPVLVMKRVEGVAWRTLIRAPDHPWWAREGDDRLRRHVEIAIAVCRALELAHDRGVVHRDLKPDNVMIGRFGEVYLMDWGVARRLDDRPRRHVVGTPAYLAPELFDLGLPLGPWTDGYLLGSCLVEVLTGEPPHRGGTLEEVLRSAHAGEPPDLGDAPEGLRAVLRRAMARDPADRYPDAAALRAALEGFLRSRDAGRLAEVGRALLAALRAAPPGEVDARFTEARFAFRQALATAPDAAAGDGLRAVLGHMIPVLAGRGDVEGAEALARELAAAGGDPLPFATRIAAARERRAAAERLLHETDVGVSAGVRAAMLSLMVASFVLVAVFVALDLVRYDHAFAFGLAVGTYGVAAVVWVAFRRPLTANAVTRALTGVLAGMAVLHLANRGVAWAAGTPIAAMLATDLLILSGALGAAAIVLGRTLLPAALPSLLCALATPAWPEHAVSLFVVGALGDGLLGTAHFLSTWRRSR